MTEIDADIASSAAWRSKKYKQLSDEEILELATKKLNDKEQLYLGRELDYRDLHDEAKDAKLAASKKRLFSSKPKWKIIVGLLLMLFFAYRKVTKGF